MSYKDYPKKVDTYEKRKNKKQKQKHDEDFLNDVDLDVSIDSIK